MYILELFCGTKSISKEFEKRGFESMTVDIDPQHNPTIVSDIMCFDTAWVARRPDVIWASPPCTHFSVAAIGKNWNIDNTPKNLGAAYAVKIVERTLDIIKELRPKFWFMENPRGKLRKLPVVANINMVTTTYCQYGDSRMKPTDIWTNTDWEPKPPCKNGMPCHESAPRGSRTGTQGIKGAKDRAVIPPMLCGELADYCFNRL